MHLLPSNLINESIFLNPSNERTVDSTVSRHESALFETTNVGFNEDMNEESVILEPSLTLYQQFFEANQKYAINDENVFIMLREFELLCSDHLIVNSNLIKSKVRPISESQQMNKFVNLLRLERNSWRLAKVMFEDKAKNVNDCEDMIVDDIITKMSDKQLIERTFERSSSLRQMQLVIDWLEHNQIDDNEDLDIDKVEFYSEGLQSNSF
jgi:hypothetical protein